jgi:MerR family transcriptional regulator, light-induced transcriptional regulator
MMNLIPEAPSSSNAEPLYNIGVVTRMTNISMATLRAWERRYDFPQSGRTSGGHRLYSEKDIVRLNWVKARIDEGMQTSQAIQALRYQEENGAFAEAAHEPTVEEPAKPQVSHDVNASYEQQLTSALIQRNLPQADQVLGEALASSSPENLILNVIGPAMADVGIRWERGEISVATEHMATNFLRQKLLMWMVSGPPAQDRPPIVLACAPNEWHEGSLLILGALLRRRRWPVIYLGQAVPMADLAQFVRDTRPSMVLLVAMTEMAAIELADWPQFLPEVASTGKPIMAYGGRIFSKQPEWQMRMAGTFLGNTFEDGLAAIERMLR